MSCNIYILLKPPQLAKTTATGRPENNIQNNNQNNDRLFVILLHFDRKLTNKHLTGEPAFICRYYLNTESGSWGLKKSKNN